MTKLKSNPFWKVFASLLNGQLDIQKHEKTSIFLTDGACDYDETNDDDGDK